MCCDLPSAGAVACGHAIELAHAAPCRFIRVDVELEELLLAFRVVSEAATDVDALKDLVTTLVRGAEILPWD